MSDFIFPVGYYRFHKDQLFNFQLNRWYSLGYTKYEEMAEAGKKIKTFTDWKNEMLKPAEKAVDDELLLQAAFYYRAAEFYLLDETPEKEFLYEKFSELFYLAINDEKIERFNVPYQNVFLPGLRVSPVGRIKSTIVIHGGFDSFIEEFYPMIKFFSNRDYEIIAFDGPGQGAARRKYGLALDLDWEKPVKTVLDYFQLDNVTLYGISMGGWLALRAAAFEPRISNVIANGHAIDYMQNMNSIYRSLHIWFIKHFRDWMDRLAEKKFLGEKENVQTWMVKHLMYITKKDKPMEALETYLSMNEQNIHSELVKQNVLLLAGEDDHFVPLRMLDLQVKALTNSKSVTKRIFTKNENASNHCQTGNIGLSLNVILDWISKISK
ncbi:MAG: alpha/beta fold hydrolase [Bacteroidota bacterium]